MTWGGVAGEREGKVAWATLVALTGGKDAQPGRKTRQESRLKTRGGAGSTTYCSGENMVYKVKRSGLEREAPAYVGINCSTNLKI